MVLFRVIAVLSWLIASTVSATAGSHASAHSGGHDHAAMAEASHSHHEMMAHHDPSHADMPIPAPEGDEGCDQSCCDGLCLCAAPTAPAAINAADGELPHARPGRAAYPVLQTAATSRDLADEGPPPRTV